MKNKLGDTALHAAAWKSRTEAVKLLLTSGADISLVNYDGKTAWELSRDPEIIDLITKHNESSSTFDEDYFGDEQDSD